MGLFAVADTHLSFFPGSDKPMGVFGRRWDNHEERLREAWEQVVSDDDTVVIAGDISWAIKLDEARYDLDWIDGLAGRKILLKGNHDLWWNGIKKLNSLYDDILFLQNDCAVAGNVCVCGTRGWLTPDHDDFTEDDERVYRRELLRLEMSLEAGRRTIEENPVIKRIVGFLHYPPAAGYRFRSGFQELFENYEVSDVYFGHLHGEESFRAAVQGEIQGVRYHLISLDYLDCRLARIE